MYFWHWYQELVFVLLQIHKITLETGHKENAFPQYELFFASLN